VSKRYFLFYGILIIVFFLLIGRLVQLTIIEGNLNREVADYQRLRIKKIPALRGIIYDRNNIPMVRNTPIYKICPVDKDKCEIIDQLKSLQLEASGQDADVVIESGRRYLFTESTAHLLGYIGEATENEVKILKCEVGDKVGRSGVEEQFNSILKGVDGGELVEVDTQGKILRKIGQKESITGKNIFLTIDTNLQKVAFSAMEGKKGAVIVSNPNTGEILTLVSSPSFTPGNLEQCLNDENKPLFNRAISGSYPPGSTFKIITSTAGLESGIITKQTLINDPGVLTVGNYHYSNWYFTQYGRTEGQINIITAIKRSTDTFFYKLGEMVGPIKIIDWAKKFGVGNYTGIGLDGEAMGFMPDPQTGTWFLGNTYHLAIGQGALGLTPLQVNQITSVIASGGKWCRPLLTRQPDNQTTSKPVPLQGGPNCHDIGIKQETIATITEGMKEVCSEGGTAYPLFGFPIPLACKTGTAEFNDSEGRTHAWLSGFVLPSEALAKTGKDQIVITVLVEGGGEGSTVAAPIAKKVLEEYFRK
jgi:penicillin-binding protein 2